MSGILCEHCTGHCCRHIALPIETPETHRDFDDIRWYLLHEGTSVFVEDGDWYINIITKCRHLQDDNRCGIYETRPKICREYSTDNCDYHSGDYEWNHHFACPEHLSEFEREFLAKKRRAARPAPRRAKRQRRPRLKARLSRPTDYAGMTSDTLGTPLPILGSSR